MEQRNQNVPPLTAVEYFAGIGLVRLGLENAGWQIVFANDFSQEKHEMYRRAFPNDIHAYSIENVFDLDPDSIPSATLATSSFPCIDLSLAGNRNGIYGAHSSAFWGFVSILTAQKEQGTAPPLVLLENVTGWLTSNNGEDFRLTIEALNKLGYSCDVIRLDALRFTPQSRPRIFVIGVRQPNPNKDISLLKNRSSKLTSKRIMTAVNTNADLNWNFLEIPEPPTLRSEGLANEVIESMSENDTRWWSQPEVERHLAMMASSHRERVEKLQSNSEYSYRTIYRRMRNGEQRAEVRKGDTAGCLRTAIGGSSRQIVIAVGKGQVKMRSMTPREYARLQGVPDTYPINVAEIQALTGFGDAVCVPAITWIAENILNPLVNEFVNWNPIPDVISLQAESHFPK